MGVWRCATLAWGNPILPSPLMRFTSEFEMGSGGAASLWPPDINCYLSSLSSINQYVKADAVPVKVGL